MSKHFHTVTEGRARPQLATLKAIIVILDKANQGGDTGVYVSPGNGTTLAGSAISSGS